MEWKEIKGQEIPEGKYVIRTQSKHPYLSKVRHTLEATLHYDEKGKPHWSCSLAERDITHYLI